MEIKKVLWLEDQDNKFASFRGALFREGYIVDIVQSVSAAVQKLGKEEYTAVIFDIKVLPGDNEKWIKLDETKRREDPNMGSSLGLELLYSLFAPDKAKVKLEPPIKVDPRRIIVFSVVYDKDEEIEVLSIPTDQIINKSTANLSTLPTLINQIERRAEGM